MKKIIKAILLLVFILGLVFCSAGEAAGAGTEPAAVSILRESECCVVYELQSWGAV